MFALPFQRDQRNLLKRKDLGPIAQLVRAPDS